MTSREYRVARAGEPQPLSQRGSFPWGSAAIRAVQCGCPRLFAGLRGSAPPTPKPASIFFNGTGDFLVRRRLYRLHFLPHHLDMEQDFTRQGVNRVGGHMVIPWFVG